MVHPESEVEDIGLKKGRSLPSYIAEAEKSLTCAIGQLENGREHHYYSWGNFNLVRLISYLIRQTGPCHVFMTSNSFSIELHEEDTELLVAAIENWNTRNYQAGAYLRVWLSSEITLRKAIQQSALNGSSPSQQMMLNYQKESRI